MDAQSRLESPSKLGLDLRGGVYLVYQVDIQGAVKQLLDHPEQDFRASLRNARVVYQDVQVDYATDRVRVLFRDEDSFAKGKAAIQTDNRNFNLTDVTVDGAPALQLILTPQEIKERQDYAVQQNIVILRNRLEQPRTRGVGTAGRAPRRGPHRHPVARSAELRRGQENPRQDGDLGISHGG